MIRIFVGLVLILTFSSHSHSEDLFSHAIVNLPYEHRKNDNWVRVVNSQEEYDDFYVELVDPYLWSNDELKPLPVIDFYKYTLIVGGIGFKGGGASLSIHKIIPVQDAIYVNAIQVNAGSGCAVLAVVNYPTIGILIPKTDKNIITHLQKSVSDCE